MEYSTNIPLFFTFGGIFHPQSGIFEEYSTFADSPIVKIWKKWNICGIFLKKWNIPLFMVILGGTFWSKVEYSWNIPLFSIGSPPRCPALPVLVSPKWNIPGIFHFTLDGLLLKWNIRGIFQLRFVPPTPPPWGVTCIG